MTFFAIFIYYRNTKTIDTKRMIKSLNTVCILIVLPGFIFAIVNLFAPIGMHTDYRYGLRAFNFIFGRVGTLNIVCRCALMIMTIYLQNLNSFNRKLQFSFLTMAVALLISTMRTRGMVFALVYILGYWYTVKGKYLKIKLRYAIPIFLIAILFLAFPQIRFYFFDSSSRARSVLLRYGFYTANAFFPIGAGFGSYGTYSAQIYWTPLYDTYGFSNYYGLSREWASYLTDNYWPAVLGQFGYMGMLGVLLLIISIVVIIFKNTEGKNISRFTSLFGIVCMFLNSLVSSSFFHTSSVVMMMLIGIMISANDYK
jgi:hypothetical protein